MMKVTQQIGGWALSVIRILFGWIWLKSGYDKLSGGFGVESLIPVIAENRDSPEWYKTFFSHVVSPFSGVFDVVIPWGEILIGLGLIIGLLIVPALVMSVFVNANYILADMIFTYPTDILIATILLTGKRFTSYVSVERWLYSKWRKSWKGAEKRM
ncbi:DoxX family membrane protein [Paenibacillus melissococcoides]|uniref:DoxX family membrane protein n=1 Tax=Paenibacillus melissococcoides TaxID=2912268 RepID=A0ABN8TXI7_9BACL|nr:MULTISPECIES: DoxX family membrane protein [Paenibacillus]MEB9896039.1 DoxX family membrane protein [Bacillus cereus]CAH8243449.1 DoxX family membrane protein [Paenibacillus melissococcoides]CAH8704548.1 DoxX family membrane protein [Paenibacillus melissococcoides]CAH8707818.1 DoxX family membrane protein [Paenibacillus melissococcoides]GIO76499.1 DoxX family protein [Paenibacillus dendritiformis]